MSTKKLHCVVIVARKAITLENETAFRNRLKRLRKAKGLNQGQLAEILGVSQALVGDWERGRLEPNLGAALLLARLYDISLDDLITGKKGQSQLDDPTELDYWKQEAKTARANEDRAKATEGEAIASRSRAEERAEILQAEVNRLKDENNSLRAQAASAVLTQNEKRLLVEVAHSLGVPEESGLAGVLERMRANLASAGMLSKPTVHEQNTQKDEGDAGGAKRRRANSS